MTTRSNLLVPPVDAKSLQTSKSWSHEGIEGPPEQGSHHVLLIPRTSLARSSSYEHAPRWQFLYTPEQAPFFQVKKPEDRERDLPSELCNTCATIRLDKIRGIAVESMPESGLEICKFVGLNTQMSSALCPLCRGLASILMMNPRTQSLSSQHSHVSGKILALPESHLSGRPNNSSMRSVILGVSLEISSVQWDAVARCTSDLQGLLMPLHDENQHLSDGFCHGTELQSYVDFDILRKSLARCAQHHTICRAATQDYPVRARVIDCKARKVVPMVENHRYIALSYVWGLQSFKSQQTQNHQGTQCCLPRTLPQTIEDAIKVTLDLGLRYLWCDRYCIEQYHSNDKKYQINQMAAIYNRATATICALGPDDDAGLPGVSTRRLSLSGVNFRSQSLAVCPAPFHLKKVVSMSRWFTRGWTFQEALLSRRCIFFAPDQAHIVCCESSQAESIQLLRRHSDSDVVLGGSSNIFSTVLDLELRWFHGMHGQLKFYNYMQHYLQRDFTVGADALPAFKGILSLVDNQSYYGTIVFHFSEDFGQMAVDVASRKRLGFAHGLLWELDEKSEHAFRRESVPSWTWMAQKYTKPRLSSLDHATSSKQNSLGLACITSALPQRSYVADIFVVPAYGEPVEIGHFLAQNVGEKMVKELSPFIEIHSYWAKVISITSKAPSAQWRPRRGEAWFHATLSFNGHAKSFKMSKADARWDLYQTPQAKVSHRILVLLLTERYVACPMICIYRWLVLQPRIAWDCELEPGDPIYERAGLFTFRERDLDEYGKELSMASILESDESEKRTFRIA